MLHECKNDVYAMWALIYTHIHICIYACVFVAFWAKVLLANKNNKNYKRRGRNFANYATEMFA